MACEGAPDFWHPRGAHTPGTAMLLVRNLQRRSVVRTPRGREAAARAWRHLGLAAPQGPPHQEALPLDDDSDAGPGPDAGPGRFSR